MSEITPVTFDVTKVNDASLASNAGAPRTVFDIAEFRKAYDGASHVQSADGGTNAAQSPHVVGGSSSEGFRAVLNTLNSLNGRVDQLDSTSKTAQAKGGDMSSGDMLMLTVRCHEFLFHCELTSNVANRTSDGVQQLFRQQS
jgi:hypothetical protein